MTDETIASHADAVDQLLTSWQAQDEPPQQPGWVEEQMAEHGAVLAGFHVWLHNEGLLPPAGFVIPAEAVAGDDDRDIDQLVDEFIATLPGDAHQLNAEHGDELVNYAITLNEWGSLLPDSHCIEQPGPDPYSMEEHLAAVADWFIDIAVSEAERRTERCCPNC